MSAQSPPPDPASPTTGVRRHHTISAHSRSARASAKEVISEEVQEQQAIWNDDEVVDQDWVGGVGAVGEKTSLHRQSSLPTRYHRGKPSCLPDHQLGLAYSILQAFTISLRKVEILPQRLSIVLLPSRVTKEMKNRGNLVHTTWMRRRYFDTFYTSNFWFDRHLLSELVC